MPNNQVQSDIERHYLLEEYTKIDYDSPAMYEFLEEIFSTINAVVTLSPDCSFLDIGCGRGYFLQYLQKKGIKNIRGIDPCDDLIQERLFETITKGTFQEHGSHDESIDIVFTCHTLHHLHDKYPLYAIREMLKISKKLVVVVEINNTNIPMLLVSLLNRRVEANAFRYNRKKVVMMLLDAGSDIIYAGDLRSCYVSGNSWFHRLLARIGARPYNIVIAKKKDIRQ